MESRAYMNEVVDISTLVLSMSGTVSKLNAILADCFILDMNMNIAALGRDVEALMGISTEEITGEPFSSVCLEQEVRAEMEHKLRAGYFIDFDATLWTRGGEACKVSLSGFYLGFISDINGYVVLKVKVAENCADLKAELFTRKRELDTFIYRTAHDLRGPLATIKGLVNLLKLRDSDVEVDTLTNLIQLHAEKLDDRLFKLLYLSNDSDAQEQGDGCLDFDVLKATLIKTLEDNCNLDKTIIRFNGPTGRLCQVSDKAICRLVKHALLHIISLPVSTERQLSIVADCIVSNGRLLFTFDASGFETNEQVRQVLRQPFSLYNELLSLPLLFNYYVAHKEAALLSASMQIEFVSSSHQIIGIAVPLNTDSTKYLN